jgi:hypothetical protein
MEFFVNYFGNKYNVVLKENNRIITSFDRKYEAVACKKQLEMFDENVLKKIKINA